MLYCSAEYHYGSVNNSMYTSMTNIETHNKSGQNLCFDFVIQNLGWIFILLASLFQICRNYSILLHGFSGHLLG